MRRLTVALAVLAVAACQPPEAARSPEPTKSGVSDPKHPSDELPPALPPLEKTDVVVGTGPEAKKGDRVTVHYTGTLLDGTKFDSSLDRGTPFAFTIGAGEVIPGWEIGVTGMQKGGKRTLVIPPHLAYDLRGSPPKIGPNATLKFEVELLSIEPAQP
ncbi:MAG TPA: FKBP-type peptidyl-prolyl cis-trans isomerase [Polyangiaceae bacterium]|nr:FKBP-type peptidyl-prolyl cis-trans isomerase [Polyangiaceae bacterium]